MREQKQYTQGFVVKKLYDIHNYIINYLFYKVVAKKEKTLLKNIEIDILFFQYAVMLYIPVYT